MGCEKQAKKDKDLAVSHLGVGIVGSQNS